MNKHILLTSLTALTFVGGAGASAIVYPDFSNVDGLQLNNSATQAGTVLRLTEANPSEAGSAFSKDRITLTSEVSFSTFFSFRISEPGGIDDIDGIGADGLAFMLQTNDNSVGSVGGGIGLEGIQNSLAIEFDTYFNEGHDPDGNHVGINFNGDIVSTVTASIPRRMNDGDNWFAWVDYAGESDLLEVRLSDTAVRPVEALLSYNVDLTQVLDGTNAYAGFTSATGGAWGTHEITSWEFRDNYAPVVAPPGQEQNVPETGNSLMLLLGGFGGMAAWRKYRK